MSKTFLITITFFLYTNAYSQTKISGGFGAINFGMSSVKVERLNSALRGYGYPAFSEKYFTTSLQYGGSVYGCKKNWIFGVEGQGFSSLGISNANYNGFLTGRIGCFDFGYVVIRHAKFLLYPLVGVGFDKLTIKILERNNSKDFNSYVASPSKGFEIYQGNFLLNFAVSGTYVIEGRAIDDSKVHWLIGLQTGYRYNPARDNWKTAGDKTKLANGPNIGISGPYVQLIVGKGKFKRF